MSYQRNGALLGSKFREYLFPTIISNRRYPAVGIVSYTIFRSSLSGILTGEA